MEKIILDVTIDDELFWYVREPLLKEKIEYTFDIVDEDWNLKNQLNICLKVNKEKFNAKIIIDSLKKNKMINRLKIFKKEYNALVKIYPNEFEV